MEAAPEVGKFLRWNFMRTDGPKDYIGGTLYWAEKGLLQKARENAYAPNATLEQLSDEKWLKERLPGLKKEFRETMRSLGFDCDRY